MSKHIPLKWTDEELKYFNKPIMKAEQTNEWAWWGMLVALIVMETMVVLKVLGKIQKNISQEVNENDFRNDINNNN